MPRNEDGPFKLLLIPWHCGSPNSSNECLNRKTTEASKGKQKLFSPILLIKRETTRLEDSGRRRRAVLIRYYYFLCVRTYLTSRLSPPRGVGIYYYVL